jgi:uncharacterized membrane protein YsdA (DUF1294 family)/cold shock CspA family protein
MNKQGTVVRWNAARGFGFIRSPQMPAEVFFHANVFRGAPVPQEGMAVHFDEVHVGGKGPRATMVFAQSPAPNRKPQRNDGGTPKANQVRGAPARSAAQRPVPPRPDSQPQPFAPLLLLLLMLGWAGLVLWGVWAQRLPWVAPPAIAGLNLLTFFIYWTDKYAAQQGRWRTQESTLHLLALAGGWPGAWFAQQMLRHKSRKQEFRAAYWGTVLLHCAGLAAWLFWLQPGRVLG